MNMQPCLLLHCVYVIPFNACTSLIPSKLLYYNSQISPLMLFSCVSNKFTMNSRSSSSLSSSLLARYHRSNILYYTHTHIHLIASHSSQQVFWILDLLNILTLLHPNQRNKRNSCSCPIHRSLQNAASQGGKFITSIDECEDVWTNW